MATSIEGNDQKETASSQPPAVETTTFYIETLTFDLVLNILYRLPVKVLMKLRCVCKSWNSLISGPKFAKDHLRFSQTLLNRHHLLSCLGRSEGEFLVWDSRLPSVFNSASNTIRETQFTHPLNSGGYLIDSCDGIICFLHFIEEEFFNSIYVWNPSIRKFKILPALENELQQVFGFGYDRLTDSYKVVVISYYQFDGPSYVCKTQVMVHTLGMGTNTWKSIQSFPSTLPGVPVNDSGKFVSGNINWLMCTAPRNSWGIVSLDLGNESYHELLQPDYGRVDVCTLTLGVLRDCLCILAHTDTFVIHVWLMKDYGNKESWTQLFAIPYNGLLGSCPRNVKQIAFADYILEDDQLLMSFKDVVFVYNPKNGTVKISEIQYDNHVWYNNHVYIESLIFP